MKIQMTLDPHDLARAAESVRRYARDVERKAGELRDLIARNIAWSASEGFSTAVADDLIGEEFKPADVTVDIREDGDVRVVFASGEDAVFVEFGAGVSRNGGVGSSPHPRGEELGFTIGSYGKGLGAKPVWGFTKDGAHHITRGTPARMPMYRGMEDALSTIYDLAREVFRS